MGVRGADLRPDRRALLAYRSTGSPQRMDLSRYRVAARDRVIPGLSKAAWSLIRIGTEDHRRPGDLGGWVHRRYPGYEQYWGAILNDPAGVLPFTGKVASHGEIEYARFAEKTPHLVLSTTLDNVTWKNTRIVRRVEDIRALKQQPGKDMHAVGGATLV